MIKYGYPIGHATRTILQGEWIHTHNVKTNLEGLEEYVYSPADIPKPVVESSESVTFQGYVHENGQVGIRNEIWIIPTVGCINKTAERLAQMADKAFSDRNIDGFIRLDIHMAALN